MSLPCEILCKIIEFVEDPETVVMVLPRVCHLFCAYVLRMTIPVFHVDWAATHLRKMHMEARGVAIRSMIGRFNGARYIDLRAVDIDATAKQFGPLLSSLTADKRASHTHHLALPGSSNMPDDETAKTLVREFGAIRSIDVQVHELPCVATKNFFLELQCLENVSLTEKALFEPHSERTGIVPRFPPTVTCATISSFVMRDAAFATCMLGTNVVHLTLDSCDSLTSATFARINRSMPELIELHVPNCHRLLSDVDVMPSLAKSKVRVLNAAQCIIEDHAVDTLLETMPELISLSFRGCHALCSGGMRSVARHCTKLKSLDVGHGVFGADSLNDVLRRCTALSVLDVTYCACIDDDTVFDISRMPSLTVLNLSMCRKITKCSAESLASRNFATARLQTVTLPRLSSNFESACEKMLERLAISVLWDHA
jgi:hypothetical protein